MFSVTSQVCLHHRSEFRQNYVLLIILPQLVPSILIQHFFVDLSYNIALCYYSMKQYAPALKHIADIIEKGIREHPGIEMDLEWFSLSMQLPDKSLIVYGAVKRCYGQY